MSNENIQDRACGAIMGAFIGNALALGPRWYYSLDELHRDYGAWVDDYTDPKHDRYHAGLESEFSHSLSTNRTLVNSRFQSKVPASTNSGRYCGQYVVITDCCMGTHVRRNFFTWLWWFTLDERDCDSILQDSAGCRYSVACDDSDCGNRQ